MKIQTDIIRVKRFKAGSVAVMVFSGSAMMMIPMCVFFGVLAFFGAQTVRLGTEYITGIGGFCLGLLYGPLFAGIFGLLAWPAAYLGMRVVGGIKPMVIEYVPAKENLSPGQLIEPMAAANPPSTDENRR